MNSRIAALASLAAVLLTTTVARAVALDYYTAPKIKSRGQSSLPIAGAGTVVVKVFVTKAGVAKTFSIVKSTNHADDAVALDIAKKSTYSAATHGTTAQDAFYDFTLKFTASGVASSDSSTATGVDKYKLMIGAGKYADAAAGLKSYLENNSNDAAAEVQLGVADEYLNDPSSAAAAFDKAGTVPSNYTSVAVNAYTGASAAAFKSKDYAAATAFAKKSVALAPGPFTYNALGTAEDGAGQSDAAIADLETARKLAAADASFKPEQKATIDSNLVSAYVNAGKIDQAKTVAAEAAKLDPSSAKAQLFVAQYYVRQAGDASTKQSYAAAADAYEQAAAVAPSADQPNLYAQAALAYLKLKDSASGDKAKADADKALAIAPDNALANLAAGISIANQGSSRYKDALVYFDKADASAKTANNASLQTTIESLIKQISTTK